MKTMSAILFIFLFHYASAELRSSHALKTELTSTGFEADLISGFHFNYKAPNKVMILSNGTQKNLNSQISEPQKIAFKFGAKDHPSEAVLYVCDDKITFCETHKISLSSKGPAPKNKSLKDSKVKVENGFKAGDSQTLISQTKRFALLDFSAKWCPGCLRFDSEVFPTTKFKNAAKKFNKVRVDVDLFENSELAEKYKIQGIPTLIITDAAGNEIERLVGFATTEKSLSFLQSAEGDPTPLKDFNKDFSFKSIAQQQLAIKRLAAAEEFERVLDVSKNLSPLPPETLSAKISIAKNNFESSEKSKEASDTKLQEKLRKEYQNSLEEAIAAESSSTRSIGWRTELIKLKLENKEDIEPLKKQSLDLITHWLADSKKLNEALATDSPGEFVGMEHWLVLMYKVDMLEAAGEPEDSLEKVYLEAAKVGKELPIPIEKTGLNLRLLVMMTAGKDWAAAEEQISRMQRISPDDFELKRRKLKVLLALKKFQETKILAEEIIKQAPGREEFWIAESLAKALIGLEDKKSARQLLTAYLAKEEIGTSKMKSIKKSFETMLASTIPESEKK